METEKERQFVLAQAGRRITFPDLGVTIGCLSGFSRLLFHNGEGSSYPTETQKFTIQITAADVVASGITDDTTFTYSDGAQLYTFALMQILPDLEGWRICNCNLLEVTNV